MQPLYIEGRDDIDVNANVAFIIYLWHNDT